MGERRGEARLRLLESRAHAHSGGKSSLISPGAILWCLEASEGRGARRHARAIPRSDSPSRSAVVAGRGEVETPDDRSMLLAMPESEKRRIGGEFRRYQRSGDHRHGALTTWGGDRAFADREAPAPDTADGGAGGSGAPWRRPLSLK